MKIAVFIYSDRLRITYANHCLRLVSEVHTDTASLSLHINEGDVVLWKHRMSDASDFHLDSAVIYPCNDRNMFLVACIHCIRDKLLHRLAAAYNRNT
jgi:hypothetical protein